MKLIHEKKKITLKMGWIELTGLYPILLGLCMIIVDYIIMIGLSKG